jgi:hypothetical protein
LTLDPCATGEIRAIAVVRGTELADVIIKAGELTATMKLRRVRALENFQEEIAELYAGRL